MSLADLPNELVIEVVKLLDNGARASLASTSTGFQEIVAPLLWESVELKLHSPALVNAKTLEGICSKLAKHVNEVTLSTGEADAKSQETFQIVLEAIRLRPLIALRLQKCRLGNESCKRLAEAFVRCPGNWNSSLREVLLPRQNRDGVGKATADSLSAGIFLKTKVQDAACRKLAKRNVLQIQAQGEQQNPCATHRLDGTSYDLFQTLIEGLGLRNSWDEIEFRGNKDCDACMGNAMSLFVMEWESFKITNLSLVGFDFESLGWTDFCSLDPTSVRKLSIRDCSNLPVLFDYFMNDASAIALESFVCEIWHLQEPVWYESEHNVENFLTSFSGLKHLQIHVCSKWSLNLKAITAKQRLLETFEFSVEDLDCPVAAVESVVKNLPSLRRIGFRMSSITDIVAAGKMMKDQKRRAKVMLRALQGLWDLTDVVVVFPPPPEMKGKARLVETNLGIAADEVLSMLLNNTVNQIHLWMRRSHYKPRNLLQSFVPHPHTFTYEDD